MLIADGAMGTMLQNSDATLEDFQGLEGCNEILNLSRPEIVQDIHAQYFDAGSDAVETNSFGCNFANLAEYDIADRIFELSVASAKIARAAADQFSGSRFVLGSMGPGTRLPSLGHTTFEILRAAYEENALGLAEGGTDAFLIETTQDLLQTRAAVIGAQDAVMKFGGDIPILVSITVEQTGTMLLGTEVPAAIATLGSLGIDAIGLNCATGPVEMSEHLRTLSNSTSIPITCMPNAGLPILAEGGAYYPLGPVELAEYLHQFVSQYHLAIIGGCCGTTPDHIRAIAKGLNRDRVINTPVLIDSVASIYQAVPFKQQNTYLAVGERANANGSKAFRDALLDENFDECVEIAKSQIRDGSHVLDLCIDYVGRDGVKDMHEIGFRLATSSTLPIMLDSTEPEVLKTGLELFGGRCILNSVNFEDGDTPDSRFQKILNLAIKHGAAVVALTIDEEGQARTSEWKLKVARRLIKRLTEAGLPLTSIMVDCLTFPIATGQEETRRDGIETLSAIKQLKSEFPDVQTILGLSNISFGLAPAARTVLNSVYLHEAVAAGLDAAIVHSSKIIPLNRIPDDQKNAVLDLIYDRREYDTDGNITKDPLNIVLNLFAGVSNASSGLDRLAELAQLPIRERLQIRIVEGESKGLTADLDTALIEMPPLEIVNEVLLLGMKTVGELFGSGQMQLPFVLQSAEVMKAAVAYLEPKMEKTNDSGKGTMLLATVKGDVHDIGKNLVDIILTNNGYTVHNIGIKQTINQILDGAQESKADVIGLSGLLVKSTVIMKENLIEINERGLAQQYPVILGGAALTRGYVEEDLAGIYPGIVRYAKDAFEGLSLMDAIMNVKRGVAGAELPELRKRTFTKQEKSLTDLPIDTKRSEISTNNKIPKPPFWGSRVVKGIALNEVSSWLDERATFMGQWGLKSSRIDGPSYEELIESEGRPRLRYWLDRIATEGLNELAVVYGYFPAYSEGNTIVILDPETQDERARLTFPRQTGERRLCLADYVKPKSDHEQDFVAFHVATMGNAVSKFAAKLFEANSYREYLELHGLSVQLTEALAEKWHARVRAELGLSGLDGGSLESILKQDYQGERFSFGYPACPDLELQLPLTQLLEPQRIGVELSEEFQLHPEQSTSAIIFHHPDAAYFNAR